MPETITLRPASAAMERLWDAIDTGGSSHGGLAYTVDVAGYALANARAKMEPMLRGIARDIARGDDGSAAIPDAQPDL